MLSGEALRVLAAANEALESRRAYIAGIREKIAALPKGSKEETRALLKELEEFDTSFTDLFMKSAKKEPEIK